MKYLLLLTFSLLAYADDFSQETVKATRLTSTVFMLEGAGGNMTALIGRDGVLLVDDDFAAMADKLQVKLKEIKGGAPRFIVNTHFHYDHTGGNEVFGHSATIIAATNVRRRLMTEQTLWKKQHPPAPEQAWPLLTFDDALTLHLDDEDVRVVHLANGHTDGDSVVFFPHAKVVSLGDLYFAGMYPIFHPEHDGSLQGLVSDLETVLKQITYDTKIVPGHGPLSTKADLQKYIAMIRASMASVTKAKRAGKNLEQIQKAGLGRRWESYSHGFVPTDRWLAMLYKELP